MACLKTSWKPSFSHIDTTESQWFAPPNVITSATPKFKLLVFSLQICFGSEWPTGVFAQDLEINCKKCVFSVTSSTLKGFQSTNSMEFPYPPSPGRWNVHHYLSNFLDDLDHVLQEPSAAKIWKQPPFSQESKELSSSIKGWSFPHLWGLCFTWHWEFCNSVWATISYPFRNLSMLGWPMGQHADSNTSAQKQACITDIPHTRATLNLSTPRHVQACGMRCCVKKKTAKGMNDLWPVLSQQRLVNSNAEVLWKTRGSKWTHDLSSFQISFGPNHQVLDFILLSREDHWSLAQGNFQLLESRCDVGITTGTMPKLTV